MCVSMDVYMGLRVYPSVKVTSDSSRGAEGRETMNNGLFRATGACLRMSCMRARKQVSPSVREPGQWERTGVTNAERVLSWPLQPH